MPGQQGLNGYTVLYITDLSGSLTLPSNTYDTVINLSGSYVVNLLTARSYLIGNKILFVNKSQGLLTINCDVTENIDNLPSINVQPNSSVTLFASNKYNEWIITSTINDIDDDNTDINATVTTNNNVNTYITQMNKNPLNVFYVTISGVSGVSFCNYLIKLDSNKIISYDRSYSNNMQNVNFNITSANNIISFYVTGLTGTTIIWNINIKKIY